MLMKVENEKASGSIEMPEGWKKGAFLVFAFLEVDHQSHTNDSH
jgi:hypothetical protein